MTKFPKWFYLGLLLNILGWSVSWLQIKPFSYLTFFFIWFGFILILDGLNFKIRKTSLISESKINFLFLFLASSLFWWYFEVIVMITGNWYYLIDKNLTVIEHQILGTLYFSTVIPAVLEMAELLANKRIFSNNFQFVRLKKRNYVFFLFAGIISLVLPIFFPAFFFPLIWISLFFILDYFNYKHGFDSLIQDFIHNRWSRALYFALAALICGFFWEMWNSHADWYWVYEVPFVGNLKVFEMPVLGFLGYLPFGLEIFAFYSFIRGVAHFPETRFFNLSHIRMKGKIHKRKVVYILTGLILTVLLVNSLIEVSLFQRFESKPLQTTYTLTSNINQSSLIKGSVVSCVLGIMPYNCLVTDSREYFILVDNNLEPIRAQLGEVFVKGNVVNNSQSVGMDQLVVDYIYSI